MTALRADCWRWVRATWLPLAAFAGALVVVTIAAYQHKTSLAWGAGLLLAATSIVLSHIVRQQRDLARGVYDVGPARVAVAAVQLAVGIVLVLWSQHGGPDALGLIGLGFAFVAGGAIVSEIRLSRWNEGVRGPVVLGAAFAVSAGAVVLLPAGHVLLPIGIGILLAMLGAELYSEDYLRTRHEWGRWPLAGIGVGLLATAVGLLVVGGAGTLPAFILVVVVLVLVSMVSSDSNSLLLVLVVVVALLWAGAPRPVGRDADLQPQANEPFMLVLGDSYISGEGASAFYDGTNSVEDNADFTNECRRAPTAWPNGLARRSGIAEVPKRVLFLACSGAEARHIRTTPPVDSAGKQNGPAELVEYQKRRAELGLQKPALVVLSLGGNDAGFGTIGQACVGPGDCAEIGYRFLDGLQSVEAKLDQSYADIKAVVGSDVPVVVTGYPIPITETGPCANVLLTLHERRFIVTFVKELNQVVKSAAARAGFDYIDTMENALVTAKNRLCEDTNFVGMNFIGFNPKGGSLWDSLRPGNWVHNSLHPNEAGHRAMEDAAWQWFVDHPTRHAPTPTGGATRMVPNMDKLFEFGFTRLCDPKGDRSCDIENNGWANDQILRLTQSALLPLTLAIVGAWMIAIALIGWTFEHNVTTANIVIGAVRWLRDRFP